MNIHSFVLQFIVRVIFYIMNIFSIYLLFRAHNHPGGGFVSGVMTSLSFILLTLSLRIKKAQSVFKFDPLMIAAIGLFVAYIASVIPMLINRKFFHHLRFDVIMPLKIDTSFLFDVGIFLTVIGVISKVMFSLSYWVLFEKEKLTEKQTVHEFPIHKNGEEK